MYINTVELRNIKSIQHTIVSFSHRNSSTNESNQKRKKQSAIRPNINLLLGNNGTGKTTILSGIALSILAPIIKNSGYFARHMVTFGQSEGFSKSSLQLHSSDSSNSEEFEILNTRLDLHLRGAHTELIWNDQLSSNDGPLQALYDDKSPEFFLLGYGATRRVDRSEDASSREKSRSVRYQRVAGLFEDHYALVPIKSWYSKLRGKRREIIGNLFDDLLPEELVFINKPNTEFLFEHHGISMPFEALSDGYRAYVGLVSDMLYHLSRVTNKDPRDVKGIILIDEIDLHLHPRWQLEVLNRLSSNLPNIQFIVTSHSAIVAGTVPDEALVVLKREDDGEIITTRPMQSIYGLSADQILVSEHFGLETTRAKGPALELRKMSRAAMEGTKSGNLNASLEYLKLVAAKDNRPFDLQSESIANTQTSPKIRQKRGWFYNSLVRLANQVDDSTTLQKTRSIVAILIILFAYSSFAWLIIDYLVKFLP